MFTNIIKPILARKTININRGFVISSLRKSGNRLIVQTSSYSTELDQTANEARKRNFQADLPDYNTSVNIHEHKLKRPDKPPPRIVKQPTWEGLKGLEDRTKKSLIPDTLKEMDDDEDFKLTAEMLKKFGQAKLSREERKIRQRALDALGISDFTDYWREQKEKHKVPDDEDILLKRQIEVMGLNIGIYCNQACNHCHVESSPKRKEMMNREVADKCLDIAANSPTIHTVDITGGAPELCSEFRHLASGAAALGKRVIDRCNLTSLLEPGQEDTAEFLAKNNIYVIASLPCYTATNVNLQRGKGVFDKSIHALRNLNALGYGKPDSGLQLDLVYNPLGAYLPPPQKELEDKYREELMDVFGIEFNKLFTITNMPIKRFADFLYRRNELQDYMELLVRNYNLATVNSLMCRNQLQINWNGEIADCDFNLQMDLMIPGDKGVMTVFDLKSANELHDLPIMVDNHCYGCTSGMGSS